MYEKLVDSSKPGVGSRAVIATCALNSGSMKSVKNIVVAVHVAVPHLEGIVHGVVDYAREHSHWRFALNLEAYTFPLEELAGWKGDGAIAMIETERQARLAKSWGFPVVNVADTLCDSGLPLVTNDNRKMGQLAAMHFKERGLRHFAFYGLEDMWYSHERCAGFREVIETDGSACSVFQSPSSFRATWISQWQSNELDKWLLGLPRPCGLIATHDFRAWAVIESCRRLGIVVPDEIAVVGVDDNPVICNSCNPPLTSVRPSSHQVGYRAAELLNKLMERPSAKSHCSFVAPAGITERESTNTIAVDDPIVRKAINYIHSNFQSAINVADVARSLGVSRRWLSSLFHEQLGKTPHDYMVDIRVKRAKDLLAQSPPLPLKDVARRCGFASADRLNKVFTRATGSSPRSFRESKLGARVERLSSSH
jgi:LacI family transcriptional regulator, galactose operon repressor